MLRPALLLMLLLGPMLLLLVLLASRLLVLVLLMLALLWRPTSASCLVGLQAQAAHLGLHRSSEQIRYARLQCIPS